MISRKFYSLFTVYCLLFTLFTLYSYTQVDLNLTLSSNPVYQTIQRQLTNVGYFNRHLSTKVFLVILFLLSIIYYLLSKNSDKWRLTQKQLWTLIIGSSLILTLSYPAFAHDIFNYMFDARTVVKYGQNPYITTPLDFPQDDWTRFMRWTHVGTVYPPGWILTALPFYLLGFGKFTLTLLSFKLLGLFSFLASSWLMLKIASRKAWILWSFNPMVLIESLSSVHNDAIMTTFALFAFYLVRALKGYSLKDAPLRSILKMMAPYVSLFYGASIKYASILLIPFLKKPVLAALAAWAGGLIFFFVRGINPWYILLPVAVSIMTENKILTAVAVTSSILVMYRYYPCVATFSC